MSDVETRIAAINAAAQITSTLIGKANLDYLAGGGGFAPQVALEKLQENVATTAAKITRELVKLADGQE